MASLLEDVQVPLQPDSQSHAGHVPAAYVEEWIKQVVLKDLEMKEAVRNYADCQLVRRGYKT